MNLPPHPSLARVVSPFRQAVRAAPIPAAVALGWVLLLLATGAAAGMLVQWFTDPNVTQRTLLTEAIGIGFGRGLLVGAALALWPMQWLATCLATATLAGKVAWLPPGKRLARAARLAASRGWRGVTTAWLFNLTVLAALVGFGIALRYVVNEAALVDVRLIIPSVIGSLAIGGCLAAALLLLFSRSLGAGFVAAENPTLGGLRAIRMWDRAARGIRWWRAIGGSIAILLPLAGLAATATTAFNASSSWLVMPLAMAAFMPVLVVAWSWVLARHATNYLSNRHDLSDPADAGDSPRVMGRSVHHDGRPTEEPFTRPMAMPTAADHGTWRDRLRRAMLPVAVWVGCMAVVIIGWRVVLQPAGGAAALNEAWDNEDQAARNEAAAFNAFSTWTESPKYPRPWAHYRDLREQAATELGSSTYSTAGMWVPSVPFYAAPPDRQRAATFNTVLLGRLVERWQQLAAGPIGHDSFQYDPDDIREKITSLEPLLRYRLDLAADSPDELVSALHDWLHLIACTPHGWDEPADGDTYGPTAPAGEFTRAIPWLLEHQRGQLSLLQLQSLDEMLEEAGRLEPMWVSRNEADRFFEMDRPWRESESGPNNPLASEIRRRNRHHQDWFCLLRCRAWRVWCSQDPTVQQRWLADGDDYVFAPAPDAALVTAVATDFNAVIGGNMDWLDEQYLFAQLNALRLALRMEAAHLQTGQWPTCIDDLPLEPWPAPPVALRTAWTTRLNSPITLTVPAPGAAGLYEIRGGQALTLAIK